MKKTDVKPVTRFERWCAIRKWRNDVFQVVAIENDMSPRVARRMIDVLGKRTWDGKPLLNVVRKEDGRLDVDESHWERFFDEITQIKSGGGQVDYLRRQLHRFGGV